MCKYIRMKFYFRSAHFYFGGKSFMSYGNVYYGSSIIVNSFCENIKHRLDKNYHSNEKVGYLLSCLFTVEI